MSIFHFGLLRRDAAEGIYSMGYFAVAWVA